MWSLAVIILNSMYHLITRRELDRRHYDYGRQNDKSEIRMQILHCTASNGPCWTLESYNLVKRKLFHYQIIYLPQNNFFHSKYLLIVLDKSWSFNDVTSTFIQTELNYFSVSLIMNIINYMSVCNITLVYINFCFCSIFTNI